MSSPEHKQKIWNLIKDIKVGMLVTKDDNVPRGRPMHLVQEDYDGTIWFFTPRSSEKVIEASGGSEVCLTFSDPQDGVHVSMSGTARLTTDQDLIDKFWNSEIAAWFTEGKEDPEVAMLEIDIQMGEHWKSEESKVFQLYEIAKANVMGLKTPDIGENEKFGG